MATAMAAAGNGAEQQGRAWPGRELRERDARAGTPVTAAGSLVLGTPFTIVGLALALLGHGTIGPATRATNSPRWIVVAMGLVFAWAGLLFVAHGVRGLLRARASRRLARRHPGQPWWSDHPWDSRGARDQTPAAAARAAHFAAFVLLFLAPFHWIGFFAPDRVIAFGVVALLFDLVALALVWRALYLVARLMRYGRGAVWFTRFPFRLGEAVELLVPAPTGITAAAELTATLRCVQERVEVRGTGKGRSVVVVCYELLAPPTAVTLTTDGRGRPAFRVTAHIPPDAPPTALGEHPPRYWELDLAAARPGVDYGARFLVPVY
jgi:hypothetical protein